MPRTPTYGRAAGPGDAVGSSIYELYAPQRASTEFGVDFARTGYEFQKEVELEKQRQLDAQIAQSQRVQDIQEQAADKARKKQRTGKKVSSATTGAMIGGSLVPGVGHIIGGLGGWLFGEEGGMVPAIHPNSLLYKQYQSGGDVTGYSGGKPKFLRRGYQNLQFRQEDLERAQENLDSMKSYGLWDAVQDIGKGYMAGKDLMSMVPDNFMKDVSQYGLGDAFKHSVARGSDLDFLFSDDTIKGYQDVMKENVTKLGMAQNPGIDWANYYSTEGSDFAKGGYVPTPSRKSIYKDQVRATKYLK